MTGEEEEGEGEEEEEGEEREEARSFASALMASLQEYCYRRTLHTSKDKNLCPYLACSSSRKEGSANAVNIAPRRNQVRAPEEADDENTFANVLWLVNVLEPPTPSEDGLNTGRGASRCNPKLPRKADPALACLAVSCLRLLNMV